MTPNTPNPSYQYHESVEALEAGAPGIQMSVESVAQCLGARGVPDTVPDPMPAPAVDEGRDDA
jgi:hypothetical protein